MRKWLKIKVFRISSFILPYLRTRWFCKTGHHFSTTKIKEDDMNNVLLDKGIITPSGEISKDKINLVAGAITQPFAEMVWVTTGGDMETINRLTDVLDRCSRFHEHPRRPGQAVQNHQNAVWAYGLTVFRRSRADGRRPRRIGILHLFLYGRFWRNHQRLYRGSTIEYTHRRRFSIPHRENRNAAFFMPLYYAVEQEKALQQAAFGARL